MEFKSKDSIIVCMINVTCVMNNVTGFMNNVTCVMNNERSRVLLQKNGTFFSVLCNLFCSLERKKELKK